MKINVIIRPIKNDKHKREVGKFWASELNSIIKGYITPKNYFDEKDIDDRGSINIFYGEALESYLGVKFIAHKIITEPQVRKEIKIDDLVLVVKPDFVGEVVIECKCPEKPITEIPERYKYQLEAEFQAFQKPVYLLSFQRPIVMYKYEPSAKRWLEIQLKLKDFNKKLLKLCNK